MGIRRDKKGPVEEKISGNRFEGRGYPSSKGSWAQGKLHLANCPKAAWGSHPQGQDQQKTISSKSQGQEVDMEKNSAGFSEGGGENRKAEDGRTLL